MFQEKFEIVVVMEGTVESTGMSCQLRTSYLPSEILWGHHLSPLVTYQKTDGHYKINYTEFPAVVAIEPAMSEVSARKLHERRQSGDLDLSDSNNNADNLTYNGYPVTFTAPAGGHRHGKRPWLRRPSLKGSLRKRLDSKTQSPPLPPRSIGRYVNASPSGATPSVQVAPNLQSVSEKGASVEHMNGSREFLSGDRLRTPSPEHILSPNHNGPVKHSTSSHGHTNLPDVPEQKPITAFIGDL